IMNRTAPLCRALVPKASNLHLSASRLLDNPLRRYWNVECIDEAGSHVAHFTWDADTGNLFMVGCPSPKPAKASLPTPLNREEARRAAWKWLRTLGMVDEGHRWRLVHAPEQGRDAWSVAWQSDDREALVSVHRHSGNLLWARCWKKPVGSGAEGATSAAGNSK